MPSLAKMTEPAGKPLPHVGDLVQAVMQRQHVTTAELARRLRCSHTTLMRSLRQQTIHAALLWKIGLLLKHNFMADLALAFPVEPPPAARELALQQELDALRRELEVVQRVLEMLKK
jgi:transcriptional regulator with XRE-family HTH domain